MVVNAYSKEQKNTNEPISTNLLIKLQRDILNEKLKPGEKLIETELCKKYKVSRTPIREALKKLEADGLVENILNRGSFVIGMSDRDYADLFELRKAYEIQAVRWAIERITEEEMDSLEEIFEFMEFYTLRKDVKKMLTINANFHQVIYEAAHNKVLLKMISPYQGFLKFKEKKHINEEEYLHEVLEEHRAIFKAFMDKNVRDGMLAMERHIDHAKERRCEEI